MITSLDLVSRAWPQPAASRYSKRPTTRLEPMRSVNGFSEACGVSALINCSSCRRSSCIVSCVPISSTSIRPDHIKELGNRSHNGLGSLFLWITREARSSPCQSWVACITITAEALDRLSGVRTSGGFQGCVRFLWEVVDHQSLSQCFSNDDDKQTRGIFPGKALHASKRGPLQGLAFLPAEAAKQEGHEEIGPSHFFGR